MLNNVKEVNALFKQAKTVNALPAEVAQLGEQIVVLTQAEYDALPNTKNSDGIVYLIKE